jgi:hypothetical protein
MFNSKICKEGTRIACIPSAKSANIEFWHTLRYSVKSGQRMSTGLCGEMRKEDVLLLKEQ